MRKIIKSSKIIIVIIIISLISGASIFPQQSQIDFVETLHATSLQNQNPKLDSLFNALTTLNQPPPSTSFWKHLWLELSGNPDLSGGDDKDKTAKKRINLLNEISWQLRTSYPDSALHYAQQALQPAEEMKYSNGIANSFNNIGVINRLQGNYDQALKYYLDALEIQRDLNVRRGIAGSMNNIGIVYWKLGDLTTHDSLRQASYDQALKYYLESLEILRELNDRRGIAASFSNIAGIYYEWAEQYRSEGMTDSAAWYYEKCMEYDKQSQKMLKEIGDRQGIAISLNNIGETYVTLGQTDSAIAYFNKSLKIDKEIGAKYDIMLRYQNLANVYAIRKEFKKAYENNIQFATYKDSVFNEEKSKEIGSLEENNRLKMEKKDKEAETAAAEEEAAAAAKHRFILQASAIFICLLAVMMLVGGISGRVHFTERTARVTILLITLFVFEFLLLLTDPLIDMLIITISGQPGGEPVYKILLNTLLTIGIWYLSQRYSGFLMEFLTRERKGKRGIVEEGNREIEGIRGIEGIKGIRGIGGIKGNQQSPLRETLLRQGKSENPKLKGGLFGFFVMMGVVVVHTGSMQLTQSGMINPNNKLSISEHHNNLRYQRSKLIALLNIQDSLSQNKKNTPDSLRSSGSTLRSDQNPEPNTPDRSGSPLHSDQNPALDSLLNIINTTQVAKITVNISNIVQAAGNTPSVIQLPFNFQ